MTKMWLSYRMLVNLSLLFSALYVILLAKFASAAIVDPSTTTTYTSLIHVSKPVVLKASSSRQANVSIQVTWGARKDIEWIEFRAEAINVDTTEIIKSKLASPNENASIIQGLIRGGKYQIIVKGLHTNSKETVIAKSEEDFIVAPFPVDIVKFYASSFDAHRALLELHTKYVLDHLAVILRDKRGNITRQLIELAQSEIIVSFENLIAGETYRASAYCISYNVSSPVTEREKTITILPSTPNIISASFLPPDSIWVTWWADNSVRDRFEITAEASGSEVLIVKNANRETRVTKLRELNRGNSYTLSMVAWSANNKSSPSTYSSSVIIPPSPPTITDVLVSGTVLTVNWTSGPGLCGLFYVEAFSMDGASNESQACTWVTCVGDTDYSCEMDPLEWGNMYSVVMKTMINGVNSTSANYSNSVQTDPATPDIRDVSKDDTNVTITYTIKGNADLIKCYYTMARDDTNIKTFTMNEDVRLFGLMHGYRYNIRLQSRLNGRSSALSDIQQITIAPSAPNITSIQDVNQSITLKWTKGLGRVDHFTVYVTRVRSSEKVMYDNDREYSFTKTGLGQGNDYKVILQSHSYDLDSTELTRVIGVAPSKPFDLSFSDIATKSFSLKWQHNVGYLDYFNIYYHADTETKTIKITRLSKLTKKKKVVVGYQGMTYQVWMEAISKGKSSGNTTERSVTVDPANPRNVNVKALAGGIVIEWTQRGRAAWYEIEIRSGRPTIRANYTPAVMQPKNMYKYRPLMPGRYTVRINAHINKRDSGWTQYQRVTVAEMPVKVTKRTTSDTLVTNLSWTESNYMGILLVVKDDQHRIVQDITLNLTLTDPVAETGLWDSRLINCGPNTLGVAVNFTQLLPDINYELHITIYEADKKYSTDPIDFSTQVSVPTLLSFTPITDLNQTKMTVNWDPPVPCPGHDNKTYYTLTVRDLEHGSVTFNHNVAVYLQAGYKNNSAHLTGLRPFWRYRFILSANTSAGRGPDTKSNVTRTLPGVPGAVKLLTRVHNTEKYGYVTLRWLAPDKVDRHCRISKFVVKTFEEKREGDEDNRLSDYNIAVTEATINNEFSQHVPVQPEYSYKFKVYAVSESGEKSEPKDEQIVILSTAPPVPSSHVVTKVNVKLDDPTTSFAMNVHPSFFKDGHHGRIVYAGLLVARDKRKERNKRSLLKGYGDSHDWKWATQNDMKEYRCTNDEWAQHISRMSSMAVVKIGVGKNCDKPNAPKFCNGPLMPGLQYSVKAYACTISGCSETPYYHGFATKHDRGRANINLALALGILMALSFVAIIVIVIVYFKRKRLKNAAKKIVESRCSTPTTPEQPLVATELEELPTHRPLKLSQLDVHVETMHTNSDMIFNQEYNWIRQQSAELSANAGKDPNSKHKNRYADILPYDRTRVKLTRLGDDSSSEYINANYISGVEDSAGYIAAQGPLPSTLDDFVRMIWEQEISTVIMLTQCLENGIIKCEQYWPEKEGDVMTFAHVTVTLTSLLQTSLFDMRTMVYTSEKKSRTVKQFHYTQWLDHSISATGSILDFVEEVNSHSISSAPILIHCSAGVGRTGTYIAVDRIRAKIMGGSSTTIDIYSLVLGMREQRPKMVQTESQYALIHDCAMDILKRKKEMEANIYSNELMYANNVYHDKEPLYENQELLEQRTEL